MGYILILVTQSLNHKVIFPQTVGDFSRYVCLTVITYLPQCAHFVAHPVDSGHLNI